MRNAENAENAENTRLHTLLQPGDFVVLGYTPPGENAGGSQESYRSGYVLAASHETTSGLPHINVLTMGGIITIAFNAAEERLLVIFRDGVLRTPEQLLAAPQTPAPEEPAPAPAPAPEPAPDLPAPLPEPKKSRAKSAKNAENAAAPNEADGL